MSAWIINAGSALARAASQPRVSGERVRCIAVECSPCACAIKQKSVHCRRFAVRKRGADFNQQRRPRRPKVDG